jgi:hypothetical protein
MLEGALLEPLTVFTEDCDPWDMSRSCLSPVEQALSQR